MKFLYCIYSIYASTYLQVSFFFEELQKHKDHIFVGDEPWKPG